MQPQNLEFLINVSFSFVSWLKNNFPEVKEQIIEESLYSSFGELIRETPTLFWEDVGYFDHETLTKKVNGESILDRVISIVAQAPPPPEVQNEILVGFVEGHMFPRPNSPLAKEMSEALGFDVYPD